MDVDAGLVEVAHAGGPGVGDGGGLRDADAEHAAGGAGVAGADADEDAGGAGAHEVQRGLVAGAAADDDGDVELADELLEVERLAGLGDVLGRHHRALDDEQVELGVEDVRRRTPSVRCGVTDAHDDDAGVLDLADALADELGLDRLGVDLLHAQGGLLGGQLGDLVEAAARDRRSGSRGPRG